MRYVRYCLLINILRKQDIYQKLVELEFKIIIWKEKTLRWTSFLSFKDIYITNRELIKLLCLCAISHLRNQWKCISGSFEIEFTYSDLHFHSSLQTLHFFLWEMEHLKNQTNSLKSIFLNYFILSKYNIF